MCIHVVCIYAWELNFHTSRSNEISYLREFKPNSMVESFNSLKKQTNEIYLYITCECMCACIYLCLLRLQVGVRSHETVMTGSSEPPEMSGAVFLTNESFSQSHDFHCSSFIPLLCIFPFLWDI